MSEDEIPAEEAPVVSDPPVTTSPTQPTEGEIQAALFFDSKDEDPYLGPGNTRSMLKWLDRSQIESPPAESSERSSQSEPDESSEP
jgi:hypothetical protein